MLDIAEIPYETGELKFRYSRRMSADSEKWVRDGLFQSFYVNGQISSEGHYRDGHEDGIWSSYHENGQLAWRGVYCDGQEAGDWDFWDINGQSEQR